MKEWKEKSIHHQ